MKQRLKKHLGWFGMLGVLGMFVVFSPTVLAKDASSSAAPKVKLTFPIAELGNCANLSECKDYCEDPVNKDACISFAKQKGFYRPQSTIQTDILAAAKTVFGCDSAESCKQFCQNPDNHQKCFDFAAKHRFGKPKPKLNSTDVLTKAKTMLNCDSIQSCIIVCSQSANYQKCSDFAKLAGLKGGDEHRTASSSGLRKPEHPDDRPATGSALPPNLNTYFFGQYCRQNPKACSQNSEERRQQFIKFCQTYPLKCQNATPSAINYPNTATTGAKPLTTDQFQAYCAQKPNCSWDGEHCQCQPTGVQGVSASANLFDRLSNLWRHFFNR